MIRSVLCAAHHRSDLLRLLFFYAWFADGAQMHTLTRRSIPSKENLFQEEVDDEPKDAKGNKALNDDDDDDDDGGIIVAGADCADDLAFKDEEGATCGEWATYSCKNTPTLSEEGQNALLASCKKSCGLCEEEEESKEEEKEEENEEEEEEEKEEEEEEEEEEVNTKKGEDEEGLKSRIALADERAVEAESINLELINTLEAVRSPTVVKPESVLFYIFLMLLGSNPHHCLLKLVLGYCSTFVLYAEVRD